MTVMPIRNFFRRFTDDLHIFFRRRDKLLLTMYRTEPVGLPCMLGTTRCTACVYGHAADRIFNHAHNTSTLYTGPMLNSVPAPRLNTPLWQKNHPATLWPVPRFPVH